MYPGVMMDLIMSPARPSASISNAGAGGCSVFVDIIFELKKKKLYIIAKGER